jgi:hypothetical protein
MSCAELTPRKQQSSWQMTHADEVNQAMLQFMGHTSPASRTQFRPENLPQSGRPG